MANISMKKLLESGVHFGHRTNKWNPKMRQYIFTERNGIHIIDLSQTVSTLQQSLDLVQKTVRRGGTILFVGTKRQAQETIREEAERCGMPYVTERWLGGTITNWKTIKERLKELERLENMQETGEIFRLTKKEGLMIQRDIDRLESRLGGVRKMPGTPDLLFVVDIMREATAVHEANLRNIPVIAMVDTNCDPRNVDYVSPSNDDAIRAIKLIVTYMADAVLEAKAFSEKDEAEEETSAADEEARRRERRAIRVDEPELSDEDLLGASTLAKIVVEEEVEDEAETVAEEVTEEVEDEAETIAEEEGTEEPAAESDAEIEEEAPADVAVEEEESEE
jgi:small subunit ribosomal protein S2